MEVVDAAYDVTNARAFGLGGDARLAGEPVTANPFAPTDRLHACWLKGYFDVHYHWAEENFRKGKRRQHACRALPPIRRATGAA